MPEGPAVQNHSFPNISNCHGLIWHHQTQNKRGYAWTYNVTEEFSDLRAQISN